MYSTSAVPNFFASASTTDSSGSKTLMPAVAAALRCGFLLLFCHLLGSGDLVRAQLADGKQLFDDDALGDDGFELVVDEVDGVDLGARVALDDGVGDVADLIDVDLEEKRRVVAGDFDGRGAVTDDLVVRGEIVVVVLFGLLVDGVGILLARRGRGLCGRWARCRCSGP